MTKSILKLIPTNIEIRDGIIKNDIASNKKTIILKIPEDRIRTNHKAIEHFSREINTLSFAFMLQKSKK